MSLHYSILITLSMLLSDVIIANEPPKAALTPDEQDPSIPSIDDSNRKIHKDNLVPSIDLENVDKIIDEKKKSIENMIEKAKSDAIKENQNKINELRNKLTNTIVPKDKDVGNKNSSLSPTSNPRKKGGHDANTSDPSIVEFTKGNKSVFIFNSDIEVGEPDSKDNAILPSGSNAWGTVQFGQEVTAAGAEEVKIRLDWAFVGPNKTIVDLSGCIVWAILKADFNSARVKGTLSDLTCTSHDGLVFTKKIRGMIVGSAREYAGTESEIIMRGPAKAAMIEYLSRIIGSYGEALVSINSEHEKNTVVNDKLTQTDESRKVTGNQSDYIKGSILQANGDFLNYIKQFYAAMQPTLALAPGTRVHVVIRDNISIPYQMFEGIDQPKTKLLKDDTLEAKE